MPERFAVHMSPAWHDKANFVVNAGIDVGQSGDFEQLWARKVTENTFEICCIPFFVYGLALGDVVATRADSGRQFLVDEVVTRSGRSVFRISFNTDTANRDAVLASLEGLGGLWEMSSADYYSVDAAEEEIRRRVEVTLGSYQEDGILTFERGTSTSTVESV